MQAAPAFSYLDLVAEEEADGDGASKRNNCQRQIANTPITTTTVNIEFLWICQNWHLPNALGHVGISDDAVCLRVGAILPIDHLVEGVYAIVEFKERAQ